MSLCSYRPANPRRIRTDSKHSLRLFDRSFLLVTRLLNFLICLFLSACRLASQTCPLTSNLSFMHSPCSFPQALLSALQALSSMIASPPRSPVRILMAVISSDTKILPSPTCPVLQVSRIVSISFSNGVS